MKVQVTTLKEDGTESKRLFNDYPSAKKYYDEVKNDGQVHAIQYV